VISPSDLLKIFGPAGGEAPFQVLRPQGQGRKKEKERESIVCEVAAAAANGM